MFSQKIGWDYDYDDGGKTVAFGLTNPKYESYTREEYTPNKRKKFKKFKTQIRICACK